MTPPGDQRWGHGRGRRLAGRELRLRVDAMLRVMDPAVAAVPPTMPDLLAELLGDPLVPFSLARAVHQECARRLRSGNTSLEDWAFYEARTAAGHDPNPHVQAAFGVERALAREARKLPFDEAPPAVLVRGTPPASVLRQDPDDLASQGEVWTSALTVSDLASLAAVHPNWTAAVSGTVPARWSPMHPRSAWTGDVVRPPAEALALVADVVRGHAPPPRLGLCTAGAPAILLVGCGYVGAAQALSMMLPLHHVHHDAAPFGHQPAAARRWSAVVVNVPAAHDWQVATMLSDPSRFSVVERRAILQGNRRHRGVEHVGQLVDAAHRHLRKGCLVAVLADWSANAAVVADLSVVLVPEIVAGIDTSMTPLWVGYEQAPWAPHGLPSPSGRLVSFWRVAP